SIPQCPCEKVGGLWGPSCRKNCCLGCKDTDWCYCCCYRYRGSPCQDTNKEDFVFQDSWLPFIIF
uniref:Uncharacterized protein n=1 Tax=Crocodylus porosus TaxID=8502 RepID=A0A7M4DYW7_CROPO